VSPAKMAELIKKPFGIWDWLVSRNHILGGGRDPLWEGAILGERDCPW